jgi:phage terminase large subunit
MEFEDTTLNQINQVEIVKTPMIKQIQTILARNPKYKLYIYYGGRGGGKSVGIADAVILSCLKCKEIAYCGRVIKEANDNSIISLFRGRLNSLLNKLTAEEKQKVFRVIQNKIIFCNRTYTDNLIQNQKRQAMTISSLISTRAT